MAIFNIDTKVITKIIKACTPPVVFRCVQNFRTPSQALKLFDGDDALFRSILLNTRLYGEYGCGNSTKWVLANTAADVIAVDSSKDWIEKIEYHFDANVLQRAKLVHVDLGELGQWGIPMSYEKRADFPQYTDTIWEQASKPDTVLIDGRFRVCSFLTSLKYANEGTSLIFDDYVPRPRYHIIEKFVKREDTCGRQCLFIVPKKSDIDLDELDIEIANFRHVMY